MHKKQYALEPLDYNDTVTESMEQMEGSILQQQNQKYVFSVFTNKIKVNGNLEKQNLVK